MAELFVGLENNQKILIPTSSEARSGNPLGSFLLVYGNTVPIGYLPLETLFDENQYPALYAMLGTNKTPDTPCDLGADWDNAVAVTLSTTDYTVTENGWFIGYNQAPSNVETKILLNGLVVSDSYNYNGAWFYAGQVQIRVNKGDKIKLSNNASTQDCHFVPFKKYAHVVIKATSGLEETQQDYVLQSLLEADSYSTEEVATGKKWIDGKMIYKKVFDETFNATTSDTLIPNTSGLNIDSIVSSKWYIPSEKMYLAVIKLSMQNGSLYIRGGIAVGNIRNLVTVEYTKAN